MLCQNCNTAIYEGERFCPNCGAAIVTEEQSAPFAPVEPIYTIPVEQPYQNDIQKEFTEDDLPEQYRPLSPWSYFGLSILFAIPLVGFVFLIVFSFMNSNINRRNFARSYWCALIIVGTMFIIALVFSLLLLKPVSHEVTRFYN